jgi:hypothetical protein
VRIRLTSKFAERLNGVDLRSYHVGQVFEVRDRDALMLIEERWAEPADAGHTAEDRPPRKRRAPKDR